MIDLISVQIGFGHLDQKYEECLEDGGKKLPRNVGNQLQEYSMP